MDEKWCQSWEKNFEVTLKSLNKFKDALKDRPELESVTEKRFILYLDLLSVELEEIKDKFLSESSVEKDIDNSFIKEEF